MEVIYFATLFLLIDIQTPSSSPTSGKYNVSYFNFSNISFGANWSVSKITSDCIDFLSILFLPKDYPSIKYNF